MIFLCHKLVNQIELFEKYSTLHVTVQSSKTTKNVVFKGLLSHTELVLNSRCWKASALVHNEESKNTDVQMGFLAISTKRQA